MQIQTVFRAGNSDVVAIPRYISTDVGIKFGQKVVVEKTADGNGIIIRSLKRSKTRNPEIDIEFKNWWDVFLKENGDILDELALR